MLQERPSLLMRVTGRRSPMRWPGVLRSVDARLLVLLLAVFALATLVWDWQYRRAQPFDIDESGYLDISMLNFQGIGRGGLAGWISQVESPYFQAPLMTALTTPFYLIFGPSPLAGLLAPLVFSLITIAATFGLARRVAGRGVAWGATLLIASVPVMVNYSRDYHFAPAATAVTTLALYCLARSGALASLRWSAGFGAFIGLMPLARTMTVAFIPGFVVAVVVMLATNGDRRRRVAHAAVSAVVAVAVASSWLAVNGNGRGVWAYLTGYGYGSVSTQYGTERPLLSFAAWLRTVQVFSQYTLLPHLLVLAAGGIALVVLVARRATSRGGIRAIATSPLAPMVFVVGCSVVALTSSANTGSAFCEPLVPAMCVLAVWALRSLLRPVRRVVWAAVALVAVIATVPNLPMAGALAGTWTVTVPELGAVAVTSGQGVIQQYMQFGHAGAVVGSHRDFGAEAVGRQWVIANRGTADRLQAKYGNRALTAVGFRHRHYNANSLNLAQLIVDNSPLPLVMVPRETIDDTVGAYRTWLRTGSAARSCLLLTASGSQNEFAPQVTGDKMASAAGAEGFVPIETWPLPDGRLVTEWQRQSFCPS